VRVDVEGQSADKPAEEVLKPDGWSLAGIFELPMWKLFGQLQVHGEPGARLDALEAVFVTDTDLVPDDNSTTQDDIYAQLGPNEGTVRITPDTIVAGNTVTLDYVFRVGRSGVVEGGGLRLSLHADTWPPLADSESARKQLAITNTGDACVRFAGIEPPTNGQVCRETDIILEVTAGALHEGDEVRVTVGQDARGAPPVDVRPLPVFYRHNYRRYWWNKLVPLATSVDCLGTGTFVPLPHANVSPVTVIPAKRERLYVTVPSQAADRSRVSVRVVPVDLYNNLVRLENPRLEPAGIRDALDAVSPLAANSDAIVYTGSVQLGEDASRVTVREHESGLAGISNPCIAQPGPPHLYWGEIHIHTELSDGYGTIEDALAYARDVSGLDFAAGGDHAGHMTPSKWERAQAACNDANEDNRFAALIGYEYADLQFLPQDDGTYQIIVGGEINVYTCRDELPLHRALDSNVEGRKELCERLKPLSEDIVLIPHHPLCRMRWDHHDPFLERVVEMYSQWGDAETRDNPRMPNEQYGLSFQEILAMGARVGAIAGSDNHEGRGGLSGANHPRCGGINNPIVMKTGLTAVWADELTRGGIIAALRRRSCYGTTGERIIVEFHLNGRPMGSELEMTAEEAADVGAQITATVRGTGELAYIDVVRNNDDIHKHEADGESAVLEFVDDTLVDAMAPGKPVYYYLRVVQKDGNRAWTSPVWITARAS